MTVCRNAWPMTYIPQSVDTSEASDRHFFDLLRARTPVERLTMGAEMTRSARSMSLHCLRAQFAELSPAAFAQKVATAWLQEDCPRHFIPTPNQMAWIQDSIGLAGILHRVLTQLGVSYYITGGVAAIAYGEPRTTRDLDLVLAVSLLDLDRLVTALEAEGFYVPGIDEVKSGRLNSLGVTHTETISRADLLIAGPGDFEQAKFARVRPIAFPGLPALNFASPEDLILSKLLWGQQTQSEKQWRDVLGIVKVQADRLDAEYLSLWAERLGLVEPLAQVLAAGE
jgi:hypothetical protein